MFLSCKCLNIILKYSGRQLPELSLPSHEFFRENQLITSTVDENFAVLKRQSALIDDQELNTWTITRCINCYQYAYAVSDNPEEKPNNLVINKSLISVDNPNFEVPRKSPEKNDNPTDNPDNSDNPKVSDNTSDSMSTKTTLMTDNSSVISRVITDNPSDKTMIFSDNIPLISDNTAISTDNTTIITDNSLTNSTISIDNSTAINESLISDNVITSDNLTLVSRSITGDSTLIGNNSKISAISDNTTISGDNSAISDNDISVKNIFSTMRSHPDFSDIYNVIVCSDNDIDIDIDIDIQDNDILNMRKQLPPGVQELLGNLHQQYEAKVKNVKDIVDMNIKKFIAKQYEYLENYKERGHQDYYVLTNKILRNELRKMRSGGEVINDISDIQEKTETVSDIATAPITQDNFILPGSLIFSEVDGRRDMKREKKEGRKRVKKQMKEKGQGDNEAIFDIEGMDDIDMEVEKDNEDDNDNEEEEEDGESDDSGHDEGIHIPRVQRGGHPTLAKSLPVSVPNFGFGRRAQRRTDGQQSVDPLDPHNIRASIKALAKSVHGDTVFGDLPRPRFSTEI